MIENFIYSFNALAQPISNLSDNYKQNRKDNQTTDETVFFELYKWSWNGSNLYKTYINVQYGKFRSIQQSRCWFEALWTVQLGEVETYEI